MIIPHLCNSDRIIYPTQIYKAIYTCSVYDLIRICTHSIPGRSYLNGVTLVSHNFSLPVGDFLFPTNIVFLLPLLVINYFTFW